MGSENGDRMYAVCSTDIISETNSSNKIVSKMAGGLWWVLVLLSTEY